MNEVIIDSSGYISSEAQFEYVRKMRASILVMGPLLARNGFARVALTRRLCNWITSN